MYAEKFEVNGGIVRLGEINWNAKKEKDMATSKRVARVAGKALESGKATKKQIKELAGSALSDRKKPSKKK
jgi:hypothetical protein